VDTPFAHSWVLLHYRLPPQPTATRVYVWRKLQRLGAIFWNDAVWVLPDAPRTREQFQWLAAEIVEMGGDASLWEARQLQVGQEDALIQRFTEQSDAAYHDILNEMKKGKRDLSSLAQKYQQTTQADYFGSALGKQVRDALISARGEKRGRKGGGKRE
jgi:hypothetical protein